MKLATILQTYITLKNTVLKRCDAMLSGGYHLQATEDECNRFLNKHNKNKNKQTKKTLQDITSPS
jgi:hypothetical protein